MDLTKNHPRSPKQKMAGLVHVQRMIDKARAAKSELLGDYIYPCPLDKVILKFMNASSEEFFEMANGHEDPDISSWVEEKCKAHSADEIEAINREVLEGKPDNQERWDEFLKIRDKIDPSRSDVTTWVDLIELDEGRI